MQIVRILSASVAGFLIAIWAVAFGFGEEDPRSFGGVYVLAAAYVVAVTVTFMIKVPIQGRVERTEDTWITSILRGFQFAGRSPVILGLLSLFAVQSLFGMPYLQVFVPWLALEVMDIGTAGMGLLIATSGFGSLAGALVIATMGEKIRHRGRYIIGGLVIYGLALGGLGLTSQLPLVSILGLTVPVLPFLMVIVVGIGQTTLFTLRTGVLMEVTPNELRGRVFSLMMLDRGFSTVGSGVGGFAIAAMGGPYALACSQAYDWKGTGLGGDVMASTQLSTAAVKTEEQVYEAPAEEAQIAAGERRGVWEAVRRRVLNIFLNFMNLQAQVGLYSGGDFDDP